MKKFHYIAIAAVLGLMSCGGGNSNYNSSDAEESSEYSYESDSSNEVGENVENTETETQEVSAESKYGDWQPEGKYKMTDTHGDQYTLVIKKGGSAELINNSQEKNEGYGPSNGSWRRSSSGAVDLSFYEGPFIGIGDSEYVMSPVLTPDRFYPEQSEYEKDGASLKVKKVE